MTLDDQIVAVATVMAVLLVFVFAYFAALLPLIEGLRAEKVPDIGADKKRFRTKVRSYQLITAGLSLLLLFVFGLLIPLSIEVIDQGFLRPFDTLRASLLVVDLFLVVSLVVLALEFKLLGDKYSDLA